ncbi:MAG: hypothetical protein A4E55_00424 [Pelotomaculum sp. PtaU1.Bin035]|nr:MAG: hypothetical protein A4E55_00424 [Pelotomaculum sp. PtaU1.Bin035]
MSMSLSQLADKVAKRHNLDFDTVFNIITEAFLQMALNGYIVVEERKYNELNKKLQRQGRAR